MVSQRNRILELKEYFSTLGIVVNIGKNKARGHKGVFMHGFDNYRIDISKNVNEEEALSILLHEFAHYVHYTYDNKLKSLDFIFEDFSDELREEIINITVQEIPKDFATKLYSVKDVLNKEVKILSNEIKSVCPFFKLSQKNKEIEKSLPMPYKYLLKYDNVKYFDNLLSVNKIEENKSLNNLQKTYIKLKSKQRALNRINSKINRLNKYYNNTSELFARFVDAYYTKPDLVERLAPKTKELFKNSKINLLKELDRIIN